MKTIAAGKFKATCLAVMDEVQAKREPVVITKNGRPIAKMVPLDLAEGEDPLDAFRFPGKIEIVGDIMAPLFTDEEYEEFYEALGGADEVIVIDTQAVIWLTVEPTRLSSAARTALAGERANGRLTIADITLNEIAMIVSRGQVKLSTTLETYLEFIESVFTVLPVTGKIAGMAMRFGSAYPKDPADRLIGATAVVHGVKLVTKDEKIRKSGEVACIW